VLAGMALGRAPERDPLLLGVRGAAEGVAHERAAGKETHHVAHAWHHDLVRSGLGPRLAPLQGARMGGG
jgi:hypothetical protein